VYKQQIHQIAESNRKNRFGSENRIESNQNFFLARIVMLDHQVASSSPFYCAVDSHDVFPIGWCESNQYQLKSPLMKSVPPPPLPLPAPAEKSSASRKVAVVQPE